MSFRKSLPSMNKNKAEYSAQTSKDHNVESVDDMLASVDQFIEGVYRDLNYTPPGNTSSASSTTSPVGATSLSGIRGSAGSVVTKGTPVISPVKRRNMDKEIARINQICDNVDQNLRSIGLFMNSSSDNSISDDLLNINLTSTPSSSTSIIILNNTSSPVMSKVRKLNLQINHRRRRSSSKGSVTQGVVDLSDIQTPEVLRTPVRHNDDNVANDDDDDVILVSADIPSVVDLCTPGGYEDLPRPSFAKNNPQLNQRRLPYNDNDVGDSCCAGPSAARRRRTEPSTLTNTLDSSFSYTDKTSNTGTPSSATTTDNTGRTPFMCPVCMESCIQRQPTSTRCGHVFCKECIEQAIRVTHKCPMCNTKLSRNRLFRIYL